jgi:hypothetical protein
VNGFCRSYTHWIHHEEGDTDDEVDGIAPVGAEGMQWDGNDHAPVHDEQPEDELDDSARGVQGLIQDLYTALSHGISGNLYQQLVEEAKRELFEGCIEESRLTFIIKLLHIKVYNQITTSGFDAILGLLSTTFYNVSLPKSFNETKALLRKIGFGYVCIHVCKYDCALFWGDDSDLEQRPVCGESRWKVNQVGRKKVPHKVLRYFPIIPPFKGYLSQSSGQKLLDGTRRGSKLRMK